MEVLWEAARAGVDADTFIRNTLEERLRQARNSAGRPPRLSRPEADLLQKINQGQGSVGKLINDESLYKNAKLSLQKLDTATEGLEDQGPLSVLGIAIGKLF